MSVTERKGGSTGEGEKHLHSAVRENLLSVFEPRDEGSGEGGEGGRADDGGPALSHSLSLLLRGEAS